MTQNDNSETDHERIFSTARGDHMMTAAILSSLILSLDVAYCYFGMGLASMLFFIVSSILSFFIPISIVSTVYPYWIDNRIEPGHFWKELITS